MSENPSGKVEEELRGKAADEKEKQDLAKTLTVRERLTRQCKHQFINVQFIDDLGAFNVKCRLVSEREGQIFASMRDDIASIADSASYRKVRDKLVSMLAYPDGIVQDPSLDKAFWESGEYTSTVLFRVVGDAIRATSSRVEEANLFRGGKPRGLST